MIAELVPQFGQEYSSNRSDARISRVRYHLQWQYGLLTSPALYLIKEVDSASYHTLSLINIVIDFEQNMPDNEKDHIHS